MCACVCGLHILCWPSNVFFSRIYCVFQGAGSMWPTHKSLRVGCVCDNARHKSVQLTTYRNANFLGWRETAVWLWLWPMSKLDVRKCIVSIANISNRFASIHTQDSLRSECRAEHDDPVLCRVERSAARHYYAVRNWLDSSVLDAMCCGRCASLLRAHCITWPAGLAAVGRHHHHQRRAL